MLIFNKLMLCRWTTNKPKVRNIVCQVSAVLYTNTPFDYIFLIVLFEGAKLTLALIDQPNPEAPSPDLDVNASALRGSRGWRVGYHAREGLVDTV